MICNLTLTDVDDIVELQTSNSFTDGWNKKMLTDAFNNGNFHCFGEKQNGKLVAFIGISLSVDTSDLEDVLVDSNYRGNGFAKSLISHAIEFAKTKNKQQMFLEVRESNLSAISLYKKLGFNKISTRKNYYSDGENALVYLKEL